MRAAQAEGEQETVGDVLEEGTRFLRKRLKADTGGRLEAELSQSAQEGAGAWSHTCPLAGSISAHPLSYQLDDHTDFPSPPPRAFERKVNSWADRNVGAARGQKSLGCLATRP